MFEREVQSGKPVNAYVSDIAGLARYMPEEPVASSYSLGLDWQCISASIYKIPPATIQLPGVLGLRFNVQLSPAPCKVTRILSSAKESGVRGLDSIVFTPSFQKVAWMWRQETGIIQIQIFQDYLSKLETTQGWNTKLITSLDAFNTYDPIVSEIGHFLANILLGKARIPKPDYIDALAQLLVKHLIEFHAGGSQSDAPSLEKRNSDKTWSLVRAARFIREHPGDDIKIRDIAKIANLSPFYFTKLFKSKFGISPHQYLLKTRIARAQNLLSETSFPLSEIAEQCGFSTQSHFTSAFHNSTGMTPRKFRKEHIATNAKCDLPAP
jgi:AraC family transcriptional regulator